MYERNGDAERSMALSVVTLWALISLTANGAGAVAHECGSAHQASDAIPLRPYIYAAVVPVPVPTPSTGPSTRAIDDTPSVSPGNLNLKPLAPPTHLPVPAPAPTNHYTATSEREVRG
jgi:hypothetical protein